MNELTKLSPALALGESLMRMLSDPAIPADKMQILLNMQKEIMADSRREKFQVAFAAMAMEIPQVDKKGRVELVNKEGRRFGAYKYAKWEDMDVLIRPILFKYGFSLTFSIRVDGDDQIMTGKLMHDGGHCETSERRLIADPGPGRNVLQAEGSGQSYAKRYIAEGLLNIVRKDEDDDGAASSGATVSAVQVKELVKLLAETATKTETFLRMFVTDTTTLEMIPAREYPRLKNALEEKKRSLLKKDSKNG